ncbi:MAG: flagellar basal body-associated FliL family protein [Pirellulaceae bacterium]|nr:flagellar basal body-associated FliL family protein [Pirellulaceae bacterium]
MLPLLAACSEAPKHPAAMQAVELLDLIEDQEKRHDPQGYVEVDLGTFTVTHSLGEGEGSLLIRFHLFGVLPEGRKAAFDSALPGFANRIRDAIITLVQQSDIEHLTDPSLAFFKSEIVAAINRVLKERLLKDVVFSEFSVERT